MPASAPSSKKSSSKKSSKNSRAVFSKGAARSSAKSKSASASLIPEKWIRPIKLAVFDILMIGIGLVVFAYFHHVRPTVYAPDEVIYIAPPTATLSPEPTLLPSAELPESTPQAVVTSTPAPTPTPTVDPNDWGAKFADKFVTGYPDITDTSYRSENISITIERVEAGTKSHPQVYFIADVYVRDIDSLRTAFAQNVYGKNFVDHVSTIAHDNGAIFAVSGDYYGARDKGIVIRNGSVYRTSPYFSEICVIYYDGVMETIRTRDFNLDEAIARSAYHAFSFGPALLTKDGKVPKDYDSETTGPNPRCAIGYFEPGHYCFVVADGRQEGYSEGLTMHELGQIFEDLGCTAAYNLDGGASAAMVFMNQVVNKPSGGGRKISDIIYIREAAQ